MSMRLPDNADEEFAVCLDNLESSEAPRRRQAITVLERLGGTRVLQVAAALTGDIDPVVAASARRICSVLSKKGLMLRSYVKTSPLAQTVVITDLWLLLDEVIFIIRRNLAAIAADSFLFSIPRLTMVTVFFVSPFFLPILELLQQTGIMYLLIFAYQIFWRPLVWQSTGMAFLAGFPENMCRRQSRTAGGWELYRSLLRAGLAEAILYSIMLSVIYGWCFGSASSSFPVLLIFVVWLLVWGISVCSPPALIFSYHAKKETVWMSAYGRDLWLSIKFGFILIILYLIVFGSAFTSLWIFGLDDWTNSPLLLVFGFLIAADVLIDPFVVGYRMLLARLSMAPRQI